MRRFLAMVALILAGETVFIPTFHPGRYFRTTLLEAFEITERQLGDAVAWYGIAAMICYALGGPLADRFAPRILMTVSLVATGLGSLYMATVPSYLGLKLLYAFWGMSTILAFWAPMIRATREWGGEISQGRAFGILDGGRGLVAALVAIGSSWAVGGLLRVEGGDSVGALRWLMTAYATICFAVAAFAYFGLPRVDVKRLRAEASRIAKPTWRNRLYLLGRPAIWLQAIVVLTAYCAYKTFAYYGHYSEDIFALGKDQAALMTSWLTFLRIIAAISAGYLADRLLGASLATAAGFMLLAASYFVLYALPPEATYLAVAIGGMAVAWTASCALRGIYFALLEESSIPRSMTGTAVGIVSFIGFTPEIFWPRLAGDLITSAREEGAVLVGYQNLWLVMAWISVVGMVAAVLLRAIRPRELS